MLSLENFSDLKLIYEGKRNVFYSGFKEPEHKPFIIKALRSKQPAAEEIVRVYHEYEVAKELTFDGVIQTYDLIEHQNTYALIQEDMGGLALSEYLKEHPLDLASFYKIALQMVRILGEVHHREIIHKDIKPQNFIVDPKRLR